MQGNSSSATNNVGYASKPVTKVPDWHALVAWDILFNNLSTGLFLVAALCELVRPAIFTPVAKVAYPVALVFLMADLTCLVLDLGDPWRFHHMLRVFKPSSPMSFGTWCLTVYSLPLTVTTVLGFFSEEGSALDFVRRTAVVIGLLPALGSAVYKGVLISTNAQPGWKDARWLGGYLTNSSLLLGCAEMLLLSLVLGQENATHPLRVGLGALLVLHLVPTLLLLRNLYPALARIHTRPNLGRLAGVTLGLGVVVPLLLVLVADTLPLLLNAVILIILGSLTSRYLLMKIPDALQHLPAVA